ncbi:MAG: class I SAM-dependent methyltransferase [Flavobacteriales bacterium]
MSIEPAYDQWSAQYDTDKNRTRDMEGRVLRAELKGLSFARVLEIGCGTGKNTEWLATRAEHVTAVDFSEGMLAKASAKVRSSHVHFVKGDVLQPWTFSNGSYDLVTFSLILEHIEHLGPVLREASASLLSGGHLYIGELHPFKQYSGTKARFGAEHGTQVVTCFDHHVSEFIHAASDNGLRLLQLGEHFDDEDRSKAPRVLALVFQK